MRLMNDFIDWIVSVFKQWTILVTGGIITAVLIVLQARLQEQYSWEFSATVFLLFLVIACFNSWRAERDAVSTLSAELAAERDNNHPQLAGTIEQTVVPNDPGINPPQAYLNVSILNRRAPSIAEGWHVDVVISGVRTTAQNIPIIGPIHLMFPNGQSIILRKNNAIYEKTMTPIPRGGLVRGWLMVSVPGTTPAAVTTAGTRWIVSFKDYEGKTYEAQHEFTGIANPPQYYPEGLA